MRTFEDRGGTLWVAVFLTAIIGLGCAQTSSNTTSNRGPSYYCTINLSRSQGVVGQHFSARIQWRSNYVRTPEYSKNGTLPPGLSLNSTTGMIEGTPTRSGNWTFKALVKDRNKGTHSNPGPGHNRYYGKDVEIVIRSTAAAPAARFPKPQRVGRSGTTGAVWEIKNDTGYSLYIGYNGARSGSITVGPHGARTLRLPGGTYSVSGRSGKPGVRPYSGSVSLTGGYKYRNRFFIRNVGK